MASRVINGKSNYIYVIQNGKWILNDRRELNDVAKYVASFVKVGFESSGDTDSTDLFLSAIPGLVKNGRYVIKDFYITSMYRPGDAAGSPHKKDKAVDFVIKPLEVMPKVFNDLAALGSGAGRNIYIAAPLKGGDVPLHIHYDNDTSRHGNYKAIEYEATPGTGTLAQITPDTARKIMKAYGISQHDQEMMNNLLDKRSGGTVSVPGFTPEADLYLSAIDAAKDVPWRVVAMVAVAGLVAYGGYKAYQMYKAAAPKKRRNNSVDV